MALSKKILGLCVIILLFMSGVTGLYWDSYFFIVKKTKIHFLNSATVNNSVKEESSQKAELVLGKLKGRNIWRLNLEQVREDLLSDIWVESVSVERELPDILKIQLQLRTIAFLYINSKQQITPVSNDGVLLPPLPPNMAPDVPQIRNINLVKNKEIFQRVVALFEELPKEGLITQKNVAEVDWSDSEGLKVELIYHPEDGFIVLGFDHVSSKAKRVESVLKYLESQKQRWRVIDASFSKKVLVRLRKRS